MCGGDFFSHVYIVVHQDFVLNAKNVDYKNISTTNYQIPLQFFFLNVAKFDDIYDKLKLWCPITITHHKVYLSFMSILEIIWRWICYYKRTMMSLHELLLDHAIAFYATTWFKVFLWSILQLSVMSFLFMHLQIAFA